jgi:hypothetical protein
LTEPDPFADLAAQLEQLRGQLARTQGEVGAVRARLEAETSQTAMARMELKHLREELAEAIEKRKLKPPPAPWWLGGEAESRAMMGSLREWVEGFLRPHYPDYLTRLPACWASHGSAIWELSTLHAEWIRTYGDEDNRDLAAALAWHDRYLPGVLARLAEAIKCTPGSCQFARRRPA